jgi:hypothetical protein
MTLSLMHPTNYNLSIRGSRFSEKNGNLENIYGLRVDRSGPVFKVPFAVAKEPEKRWRVGTRKNTCYLIKIYHYDYF